MLRDFLPDDDPYPTTDQVLLEVASVVQCILDALTEAKIIKPSNEKGFKGEYFHSDLPDIIDELADRLDKAKD
jgi:hypothetical protein